jgi:hypothetical protein
MLPSSLEHSLQSIAIGSALTVPINKPPTALSFVQNNFHLNTLGKNETDRWLYMYICVYIYMYIYIYIYSLTPFMHMSGNYTYLYLHVLFTYTYMFIYIYVYVFDREDLQEGPVRVRVELLERTRYCIDLIALILLLWSYCFVLLSRIRYILFLSRTLHSLLFFACIALTLLFCSLYAFLASPHGR